jgi:hypothetical protein
MSCSISDMTAPNMAASDTTASFNSAWKYIFLLLQMGQIAYICWMKYKGKYASYHDARILTYTFEARHHTHRTEPTVKKRKISDGDPVLFQLPSGQIGVIPFCYDFKQTPQVSVAVTRYRARRS